MIVYAFYKNVYFYGMDLAYMYSIFICLQTEQKYYFFSRSESLQKMNISESSTKPAPMTPVR